MATELKSRTIVVAHKYTGHQAAFVLFESKDSRGMGAAFERSLLDALRELGVPPSEIGIQFVEISVKK